MVAVRYARYPRVLLPDSLPRPMFAPGFDRYTTNLLRIRSPLGSATLKSTGFLRFRADDLGLRRRNER